MKPMKGQSDQVFEKQKTEGDKQFKRLLSK